MAKVGIVMGSDSDMPIMAKAAEILDKLGIDYEMTIISAHREPDIFFQWAKSAEERGIRVIIAGAGKAAHLPGMCAALFSMPVIGIPMKTSDLGGVDSLYSIVQMPSGIPVATVAINGGANAGILAAKILAVSDEELLQKVKDMGVDIAEVTLHVGLGTFRPVKVENVLDHHMHSEFYMVSQEAADKINRAKESGHRVIAVGTTSTRTLEAAADENGRLHETSGWTEIFIYPGYQFKVIDALITNFHLPQSTLVMLVSALAGREHVLHAYEIAVKERYRFFSFGDAMLIQ